MPTALELKSFARKKNADSGAQLVPEPPVLPEDVKRRFPSLGEWERRLKDWAVKGIGKPS